MQFVFCNDKFIPENEPCITISDRGFLFGDAVFTTIKIKDGYLLFFQEHLTRLKEQCNELRIIFPEIRLKSIQELILKNHAQKGIYRLKIIITGGNSPELLLKTRAHGKLLMTLSLVSDKPLEEARLTLYPNLVCRPSSKLKTLSYLDRLMISDYAVLQGFDDAIVLSAQGYITETAYSNIFWRLDLDIFIPDPSLELLNGITLTYFADVLRNSNFKVHYVKEKLENISDKSQIFICNAIKGVVPVVAIDEKRFHRDVKLEREIFKHVEYSK